MILYYTKSLIDVYFDGISLSSVINRLNRITRYSHPSSARDNKVLDVFSEDTIYRLTRLPQRSLEIPPGFTRFIVDEFRRSTTYEGDRNMSRNKERKVWWVNPVDAGFYHHGSQHNNNQSAEEVGYELNVAEKNKVTFRTTQLNMGRACLLRCGRRVDVNSRNAFSILGLTDNEASEVWKERMRIQGEVYQIEQEKAVKRQKLAAISRRRRSDVITTSKTCRGCGHVEHLFSVPNDLTVCSKNGCPCSSYRTVGSSSSSCLDPQQRYVIWLTEEEATQNGEIRNERSRN